MPDQDPFQLTLGEKIQVQKLAELYGQTKALLLYSEEVDPEFRSNLQAIKELRDAFDHVMRVFINVCKEDKSEDQEYGQKNIDKAIGHVYRAAFDALDGAVVSLKFKLSKALESFDPRAIREVVPNYWEIKTHINSLEENIASHRGEKDVKAECSELFEKYVKDVEQLKEYHDLILRSGSAIQECQENLERERKKEGKSRLWHPLPSAIIAGLVVLLLTILYNNQKNDSRSDVPAPQAAQNIPKVSSPQPDGKPSE